MRIAVARVCASTGSNAAPMALAKLRTRGLAPSAWMTEMRGIRAYKAQLAHFTKSLT